MDLSELERLENPAKVMKLSEAIRIGCHFFMEKSLYSGCAIGTGYKQRTGRNLEQDWLETIYAGHTIEPSQIVANVFNVPLMDVITASTDHFMGRKTREECADWLESKGH